MTTKTTADPLKLWMMDNFPMCGRMISGIKKEPPGERCVFNGNICTKKRGKIWFGDINLVRDAAKLKELADQASEPLFILREYDARFENETTPLFDKAIEVVNP